MDANIPSLRRPEEMRPVRTQIDLYRHWRALMGELGFSETVLWWLFFDADGRALPPIQQIGDLPDVPDEHRLTNLLLVCEDVIEAIAPGGSVAFLRSRPGRAGLTASDRQWASRLTAAARKSKVRCHPFHTANDEELRVFTPDDEISAG